MAPSLKIFKILRFFKGFGRFWPRIGKKIQQKTQFPRHLFNSVSDCRFRNFRPFSAIAEIIGPTTSTANSAQLAIEPAISCLQVMHTTTEPRHPNEPTSGKLLPLWGPCKHRHYSIIPWNKAVPRTGCPHMSTTHFTACCSTTSYMFFSFIPITAGE